MHIAVVPIVLGRGERLWDGLGELEQRFEIEATCSPSGVTHLTFTSSGVARTRTEAQGDTAETKARQFSFPDLFDLHSAALYLRSQPLRDRSVYRVCVDREKSRI